MNILELKCVLHLSICDQKKNILFEKIFAITKLQSFISHVWKQFGFDSLLIKYICDVLTEFFTYIHFIKLFSELKKYSGTTVLVTSTEIDEYQTQLMMKYFLLRGGDVTHTSLSKCKECQSKRWVLKHFFSNQNVMRTRFEKF